MADWKQAFDVINKVLGVVSAAGSVPGINIIPYVGIVSSAASALQAGLNAGVKIAPYVIAIEQTFAGGLPDAAGMAALKDHIADLEAQVDAPLPPKEAGEDE